MTSLKNTLNIIIKTKKKNKIITKNNNNKNKNDNKTTLRGRLVSEVLQFETAVV